MNPPNTINGKRRSLPFYSSRLMAILLAWAGIVVFSLNGYGASANESSDAFRSKNLLYNSSFELGAKGYDCVRNIFISTGIIDYPEPGMLVDGTTAHHGSRSLKLFSSPEHFSRLVSHEFKLEPGNTYVLSFWAKSELGKLPVRSTIISQAKDGKTVSRYWKDGPEFSLEKDWQRYSFTFTAGDAKNQYYFFKIEPAGAQLPKDAFWIDEIQLEEGALSDYAPAAPVETAVEAPEMIVGGDEVKGRLTVISYNQNIKKSIPLKLVVDQVNQAAFQQGFDFSLEAQKPAARDFSVKKLPFGPMTLVVEGDHATHDPGSAFFIRVHPPIPYSAQGFNTGVNGHVLGSNMGRQLHSDTEGDVASRATSIGLYGGIVRIMAEINWRDLEPAQGQFEWKATDRIIDELRARHVEVLYTFGPNFGTGLVKRAKGALPANSVPTWAQYRDRNGKPEGISLEGATYSHATNLPQIEDWREYISAVTKRYIGRIKYYEILNEPNTTLPPKVYLEYLQSAYEEIRKADPNAKVVGICATEDLGGRALEYIDQTLAVGAGNYLDIVSNHPYGSRMDDSAVPAMGRIREIKNVMKKAGVDKPLWNTETFYLNSTQQGHGALEHVLPVGAISRRLLIDMGEGMPTSVPVLMDQLFRSANKTHIYWMFREKRQPNELFTEQNTASYFLTGAKPIQTMELPGDVLCYLFKNGNKLLAGIWGRTSENVRVKLDAPKGAKLSSYDVYGNSIQSKTQELSLTLGRVPQYLEWSGCDADAAAASLKQARISFENDFKITLARVFSQNGKAKAVVELKNTSVRNIEAFDVTIASPSITNTAQAKSAQPVAPLQSTVVEIPIQLKPDAANKMDLSVSVAESGKQVNRTLPVYVTNVLDVYESRPSAPVAIAHTVAGKIETPEDLSATFSASYDGKGNLVLDVHVKDDQKSQPASSPHAEDCIEIFIDAFPLKTETADYSAYQSTTYQITVAPWRDAAHRVASKISNVTAEIVPTPSGYEAKISVPLGALEGRLVGFDIAIDDSDPNAGKSQTVWNGTNNLFEDRSVMGALHFCPTPNARIDVVGKANKIELEPGASSPNTKLTEAVYMRDSKNQRLSANCPVYVEWQEIRFTFTPKTSGPVQLALMGGKLWAVFDNITIAGATLLNGSFETLDAQGIPTNWRVMGAPFVETKDAASGAHCVKVNHDNRFTQTIQVTAGQPVTVTAHSRAAVEPGE